MAINNALLIGGAIAVGVGLVYVTRNQQAKQIAQETFDTVTAQFPNMPWQNKLPSDFGASNFNYNFGGITFAGSSFGDFLLNLSLGDIIFGDGGDVNISYGGYDFGDLLTPAVDSSCNMCQQSVASEPLMPYVPVAQEQKAAVLPQPNPTRFIVGGRNTNPTPPYQGFNGPQNIGFGIFG